MRLICYNCERNNRYTIGEIARSGYFSSKMLLCKHCGLNTLINTIVAKIIWAIIVGSIIFISLLLLREFEEEITSSLAQLIVYFLFALALYFLMMPLYALIICFANNCKYRIRQNRKKNP